MPDTTLQRQLAWSAHPAAQRPGAAALAAAAILAIAATAWGTTGSAAWGVFAAAVLVAALNRFYFRSRFQIDDEGITVRYPLVTRYLAWRRVRRFAVDGRGGYLSTRSEPSRLDAFGGLHVLFGEQRDAVIEQIRARLPREPRSPSPPQGGGA